MNDQLRADGLARIWIECWNNGTPDEIPLSENFKHTSPYGCVEGRRKYLDWVKPLAKQNVIDLRIRRTLCQQNEAVIHFEMRTPKGLVQVCDWVVVNNGQITEIHSFYDAGDLR